jgi:hypothetical protein
VFDEAAQNDEVADAGIPVQGSPLQGQWSINEAQNQATPPESHLA